MVLVDGSFLTVLGKGASADKQYFEKYGAYVSSLLAQVDYGQVQALSKAFLNARERGATIFFAGNGGSAATASHFAQDIAEVARKGGGGPFRTISLNENSSLITALSNDHGYENIFTRQMRNLFRAGDLLVVISASGNSPNVVAAAKLAKEMRGETSGFTGFDGGELAKLCVPLLHVRTAKGEYAVVEDVHLVLAHMITSYLIARDIADVRKA